MTKLAFLLLFSAVCFADDGDVSRATKFASPEKFVAAVRSFHPATKPSELSYVFAAHELGNDDSAYGKLVFADGITEITELSRTSDVCAYFVKAEPKTDYTRSYVAAIFLLKRDDTSIWRITTIERFCAIGVGGWIECKVIQRRTTATDSPPLTFRVTETDAGRRDVLAERVYTLADEGGVRLKPVNAQ